MGARSAPWLHVIDGKRRAEHAPRANGQPADPACPRDLRSEGSATGAGRSRTPAVLLVGLVPPGPGTATHHRARAVYFEKPRGFAVNASKLSEVALERRVADRHRLRSLRLDGGGPLSAEAKPGRSPPTIAKRLIPARCRRVPPLRPPCPPLPPQKPSGRPSNPGRCPRAPTVPPSTTPEIPIRLPSCATPAAPLTTGSL